MALTAYKLLKGATQTQLAQAVQLELGLGNRVLVYQTWSRGGYLCQGVGTGTLANGTISSYFIITHANDESFVALLNTQLPYYQPVGAPIIHNNALYQVMAVVTPVANPGTPGKTPVLRVASGYIQWKYETDTTWINLVALSAITGPSVEIGVDDGYIKWRQTNSPWWEILVSLDDLKGPPNSLNIGTVTTGSTSAATITGEAPEQTLNLTLQAGPPNTLNVGTVSTVSPATPASVTITGTAPTQTINFNIPQGNTGAPNTLTVGTVTTLSPGASATATITGTAPNQTINFGLPAGATGAPPTITIGTVTTLAAGSPGTATVTGTAPNFTLNLGIPVGATGPANSLSVGTVSTGAAAATITGTAPTQTLNLTLPNFNPLSPVSRTITIGTAYQHTDTTRAYRSTVNVRATQTLTIAGTAADRVELRVGPSAASVAPSGSGGFSVGVWESGITGIALMIGAGIQDGGTLFADVPAGWYFQINRLSGTNATVVSCFTQTMGV